MKVTIDMTDNSVTEDLIVIVYPESTKLRNKLLSQIEKDQKKGQKKLSLSDTGCKLFGIYLFRIRWN